MLINQARSPHFSPDKVSKKRKLLVIDAAYALEAIRERGLEDSVTYRDLDGFFEKVWTIHPFASHVSSENWTSKYGRPEWHSLAPRHTFIDGKVGRFSFLKRVPILNFLICQIGTTLSLVSLIRKENIDLVLAAEPHYNGLMGWVLSRFCRIPLIIRLGSNYDHKYKTTGQLGMPHLFKKRWIEKIFERFVLKHADLVAAANQEYLDFALANGARLKDSTLFRYGNLIARSHLIEPEDRLDGRTLLEEIGVKPGQFLLSISRLEAIKHTDDVIRVISEIRSRGYDFKCVLAGDGQLRSSLIKQAEEMGVQEHVIFCGNKDQEWLSRVIPLAGAIVSPITGRALSEAALGAAPIVAYDVDWQSELVQTGETGELVPHLDWKKMADSVERFLTDPAYARSMGKAVRNRAMKVLDPKSLDQHERDQYEKLLNRFKTTNLSD